MEFNIRITGAAGQGMQTAADLLGRSLLRSGLHVYVHQDIESRIRGGINFSQLRCSDRPVHAPVERVDLLVSLSPESLRAHAPAVNAGGMIFATSAVEPADCPRCAPFVLSELARKAGNDKTVSTVAAAVAACALDLPAEILDTLVDERFGSSEKLLDVNRRAVQLTREAMLEAGLTGRLSLPGGSVSGTGASTDRLFVSGAASVALGALAGGCTFMAAYPMSPATGIMTTLSELTHDCGVWVEQAEDEIAAINMVAGASYAGARSMTASSGGGFALMTEGVSLLGMIECPAVIVIAQRPGPATGLPTRTAQGDLRLALNAGHGRFARVILAPRTVSEAYALTARAFDLAERYQIPVFVLTDQILQDCQTIIDRPDVPPVTRHVLTPEQAAALPFYERYAQTGDGISPMALPGQSRHVVCVDSDEHDPAGHLIEDAAGSAAMAAKRLRRIATVDAAAPLPECTSHDPALPLVVSWGTTAPVVVEALDALNAGSPRFNHLQVTQLWPLPDLRAIPAFAACSRLILVEHSVGDGLDGVLAQTQLRGVDAFIGKLDGRPFTVEELTARIGKEDHHG
ncbi:MAG: 2-oxoacid:acceptor oxidoreductase subunit alpha [Deltaproteobacteria bacterium HGW-Deltaproteobacteria-17]|nr:MAG: 2-oxoacid:acceptor oxidoreductase subunit alpha [Deltaproteobacteria bacterium HGW-Deltaproteobacteria-17]